MTEGVATEGDGGRRRGEREGGGWGKGEVCFGFHGGCACGGGGGGGGGGGVRR